MRVFDSRMLRQRPALHAQPMHAPLHYFVPSQIAAAAGRLGAPRSSKHVTSVAYSHTGHQLLASYSNDSIYSFRWGRRF